MTVEYYQRHNTFSLLLINNGMENFFNGKYNNDNRKSLAFVHFRLNNTLETKNIKNKQKNLHLCKQNLHSFVKKDFPYREKLLSSS